MKSIKDLRNMAMKLREMNILPPYFLSVQQPEVANYLALSGAVSASEYGDHHVPKYNSPYFYEVGAREEFRFVTPERRKIKAPHNRRKGDLNVKS